MMVTRMVVIMVVMVIDNGDGICVGENGNDGDGEQWQ